MFGAKINFWPEGTPYNNNQGRIILLHLIWMFIVGIIIGAIARFLMPGSEHMSILMTGILVIVGSIVGGFIARLFSKPAPGAPFHPAGIIMSVVGAVIVLFVWNRYLS